MKKIRTAISLTFLLGVAAIVVFCPISPPHVAAVLLLVAASVTAFPPKPKKPAVRLGGLTWTREELCHSVMLTGAIGSGKTCALNALVDQVFQQFPDFGGLWLDAKGDSHAHLLRIAKKYGREKDIIMLEVPFEGRHTYPKQTMNLMEAGNMGSEVVAEIVAEISTQGESKGKNSSFFRAQTVEHVAKACEFFKATHAPLNAKNLKDFLCDPYGMRKTLEAMGMHTVKGPDGEDRQIPDDNPLTDHWWSYILQAPDQRSGVISSIANALTCFASGEVAEIFSADSSVDFNDINNGKIFCVTIPSSYPRQKAAVYQFIKALFFSFGKRRYDLRKFANSREPLILCMLDEYQASASPNDVMSVDKLRDAGCAFIAACQDESSLTPVVGRDIQPGLVGKFRNRFIFKPESPESDEDKSKIVGKKRIWRTSYGHSGGKQSSNRAIVDDYIILPQFFRRKLKTNRCVILHTNGKYKKNVKLPLV